MKVNVEETNPTKNVVIICLFCSRNVFVNCESGDDDVEGVCE